MYVCMSLGGAATSRERVLGRLIEERPVDIQGREDISKTLPANQSAVTNGQRLNELLLKAEELKWSPLLERL